MHTFDKPIKIGIVDSGISMAFLRATAVNTSINIKAGASFSINRAQKRLNSIFYDEADIADWRSHRVDLEILDHSGHGTAVASIIHRNITVPVELYIAKILDEHQSGSAIALFGAMSWLINEVKAGYVNLSLGTNNWQVHSTMLEFVRQAKLNGCKLFSAAGDIPTLPSELCGVTAVGIPELALGKKGPIKLDCVALEPTVLIFKNGDWGEVDMSASYACPLILARDCMLTVGENRLL